MAILSVCYHIAGIAYSQRLEDRRRYSPQGKQGLRLHYKRSCKIQWSDGYMKTECVSFPLLRITFSFLCLCLRCVYTPVFYLYADNMRDVAVVVGRPRLLSAGEHLSRDQCILCVYAPSYAYCRHDNNAAALSSLLRVRTHQGAYAARCRRLIN